MDTHIHIPTEYSRLSIPPTTEVGWLPERQIVEGQVHGGIAQGVGQALLEQAAYDEGGNLL